MPISLSRRTTFCLIGLITCAVLISCAMIYGHYRTPPSPFPAAPKANPEVIEGLTLLPPTGFVRLTDKGEEEFSRLSSTKGSKAIQMYLPAGKRTIERHFSRADIFLISPEGKKLSTKRFAATLKKHLSKVVVNLLPIPMRDSERKMRDMTYDSHGSTALMMGAVAHTDRYIIFGQVEQNEHLTYKNKRTTYSTATFHCMAMLHNKVYELRLQDAATTPEELAAPKAAVVEWLDTLTRENPSEEGKAQPSLPSAVSKKA